MRKNLLIVLVFLLLVNCSPKPNGGQDDLTKYIDPTIGNVSRFLVPALPTMHLPNQMLRMFPIKKERGYISDQIDAFPLQVVTHRSNGFFRMKVLHGNITDAAWKKQMNIDHDLEVYHPWFYSTYLIDEDIRIKFAPGKKSAIYTIEFSNRNDRKILFQGTKHMNSKVEKSGAIRFEDKYIYKTRGIFPQTREVPIFIYLKVVDENGDIIRTLSTKTDGNKFAFCLGTSASLKVSLQYAVSYVSAAQAEINFEKELERSDFEQLSEAGKKAWEKVMNQIKVRGGSNAQKRSFYTSLYRTYERMVDINEYGKYFSGYDGKVHESNRPFYVDDWVWDTYRATHPLRTILSPELENDMLNSYTLMYQQSGWMPTFPQVHGNHMCMNAYHSSAIFIDGYRKGLRNYDIELAYEGIKKNMTEGTFIPWRQGTPRRSIDDFYHENGYFPSLAIGEKETEPQMDGFEKRQPVAVTLGINFDFWAMTELAKELGKDDDVEIYASKAYEYKQLWNPDYRLFMPKDDDGKWVDINPKSSGGPGFREYYDENNGWTYAWDVQHDIDGLTELLGGKKAAEKRLDELFREPLGMRKREFALHGSNSTGMVGQFSMGNEPSFHIPYLYNYFGAPWKTQKRTRFLLDVWFKDNIFGIPGDEDGGGMTAFVVFSSMGIYPVVPGEPYYAITSPVFEEVSIHLTNGKEFKILAPGAGKTKKYIQKAFINGKEISSPFITHKQIMDGATLELKLGDFPDKSWGSEADVPEY